MDEMMENQDQIFKIKRWNSMHNWRENLFARISCLSAVFDKMKEST